MTYLSRILEEKRQAVLALKQQRPLQHYLEQETELSPCRDFQGCLKRSVDRIKLIAEIKKASPSRGLIVSDFKPLEMARRYMDLGASAFSVLTEEVFFQGSPDYLKEVRRAFSLPVLRKDFILDECQIFESRLMGADAILLIVAALDPHQLQDYLDLARQTGLHVLVEVHDHRELDIALNAGSMIIGINNRDLRDFSVNLHTSIKLRPYIPEGIVSVSESGVKTAADAALLDNASFDAVLIGEGLHVSEDLKRVIWTET
ncbi:indole-3-glycerol phosphate synthase TrpC [Chlorobium phaeobacteroides]|uniref:Indole-3-glycerol phosphate synthase n=1 Tax=Chlorobium phaeobacteroides (strain DSM 266 / SMG 266 / 2430) TaxID=290317 RepID=TRPC_CHLPD|nr:indole-3-glycerol phosphate synthase TrpC [Chlorobium phaeobacteroides]A1BDW1.1 RecName: Full=Indole-3-glycerol phosphate synthase; Short=IGPS [Chlorobium phaeobacteroides DSM 266]ABL64588.1 indole-3-glycerol phosphate synthase [Chlorobium phaeobacteroides DSM 266]